MSAVLLMLTLLSGAAHADTPEAAQAEAPRERVILQRFMQLGSGWPLVAQEARDRPATVVFSQTQQHEQIIRGLIQDGEAPEGRAGGVAP